MTKEQFVRWFDANKKKPPTYKDVLLSDGESVRIGCYYGYASDSGHMWGDGRSREVVEDVTHWMFLPLPPKSIVAETGSEFQPDTDPTPSGHKSIHDYQSQLKAKRKRK